MSRSWNLQKPACRFYSGTVVITAHQTSRFSMQSHVPYKINDCTFQGKPLTNIFFFASVCASGRGKLYLIPHELSWRCWPKAQSIPQQSWRKVGLCGMEPSRWQKLSRGQLVWRKGEEKQVRNGKKWFTSPLSREFRKLDGRLNRKIIFMVSKYFPSFLSYYYQLKEQSFH